MLLSVAMEQRVVCASRVLIGAAAALFASVAMSQEPGPAVNPGDEQALKSASTRGLALFKAFQENQDQNTPASAAARALIKDFCADFEYRAVTVQEAGEAVVYFIGVASQPDAVVFGRHYRVANSLITPSTKGCLAVPSVQQGKPVGVYGTHLLSETPTEFHVFESYLHHTALVVMTHTGVWQVQDGDIRLLPKEAKPGSPLDRPVRVNSNQQSQQEKELAPLIAKARQTYPEVRQRFLKGLPRGEHLAVVTRLIDKSGRFEQVFIRVKSSTDGRIDGTIMSEISLVSGYKYGDPYSLPESEILDWVISKPDGSEEGNLIGKYLDSHR